MKRFISKIFSPYLIYSSHIFKFMVNQVTMSALGLIVFVGYILTKDVPLLQAIIALFPPCFFCFLLYDAMFEFGHKDSVSIASNKIKFDKLFGAKIFFFSYLPSLIIIVINIIFALAPIDPSVTGITLIIYYILNASNLGIISLTSSFLHVCITMVLMCFPPLISCTLGYYLGATDLPIRKILGIPIKNPEEKTKRK